MKLYAYFLLLLLSPGLAAQSAAGSPHGGQLRSAGNYRMEVVDCSGYLEVYLYTLDMQPLFNRGLSGQVDLHYPDSSCATVALFQYGIESFTAEADREGYTSCEVFIRGRGISIHAKFDDLVCRRPDE